MRWLNLEAAVKLNCGAATLADFLSAPQSLSIRPPCARAEGRHVARGKEGVEKSFFRSVARSLTAEIIDFKKAAVGDRRHSLEFDHNIQVDKELVFAQIRVPHPPIIDAGARAVRK